MEEIENVSVFKGAIKPAITIGLTFVLFLVALYVIDAKFLAIAWLPLIALLCVIIAIVVFGVKFRNINGGYLSYGKAYLFCVITFALATLISNIYNILLFEVIDPELGPYVADLMVENSVNMMRKFGQSEAAIDSQYDQIKQQSYESLTAPSFVKRYFILLIIYAVITLLTALIVKKSEPIEDVY